jgi:hypothetical protein
MNPLLILGALGAVGLYLYSQQSTSGAGAAPAGGQSFASGTPVPGGVTSVSTGPGGVNLINGYPSDTPGAVPAAAGAGAAPVANSAPAGAPAGQTTSGAPLYHTGYSDATTGAVIATDDASGYWGNPYIV